MKEGPGPLQLGSDSEATITGSTVHVRSQGQGGGSGWDWPPAHSRPTDAQRDSPWLPRICTPSFLGLENVPAYFSWWNTELTSQI